MLNMSLKINRKNNYLCNSRCIKTSTHKIMHIVTDVTVLNLIYNGNA